MRYGCSNREGTSEEEPLDFHSPYGCSKGAADQYVRDYARIYGLNTAVFRMSCIAGPRQFGNQDQGWVAHFLYSALNRKPVTIYGDGLQVRDVLDVADLVRAFEAVRSLAPSEEGRVYNVGGGPAKFGFSSRVDRDGRGTHRSPTRDQLRCGAPGRPGHLHQQHAKAAKETGWKPTIAVPQTLGRIHQWWKQNRELFAAARVTEMPGPVVAPVPMARIA